MALDRLSRRDFTFSGAVAAAAAAGAPFTANAANETIKPGGRPNILFITMDQHRFDALGCAGNTIIKTPHLDSLAARGTRFSHTYTQGPLCQPARASLMTGQYVKQHGQTWNGFAMKPEWPTMMKAIQRAGYTTALIGKGHFYAAAQVLGFDYMSARLDKVQAKNVDLRLNTPWCLKFGLDYMLEEFDRTMHKIPGVITPYTEFLRSKGLFDAYLAELPTEEYGGQGQIGHTSKLPEDVQLSSYIRDRVVDWLHGYKPAKPFFLWASFIEPHPPILDGAQFAALYENTDIPTGTRELPYMPDNAWGKYLRNFVKLTKSDETTDESALKMARYYYGLVSEVDHKIGGVLKAIEDSGHGRDTWIVYTSDHGEMLGHHNLVFKMVFYNGAERVPNIVVPPGGMAPHTIDTPVQSVDLTATMVEIAGAHLPTMSGRSLLPLMHGEGKPREVAYSELAGFENAGNYFVMAATPQYRYLYDKLNKIPCELFDLNNDPGEMHNLVDEPNHAGIMSDLHKDYIQPFLAA